MSRPNLPSPASDYIVRHMREERMTDDASLVAAALQGGPEAYAPIVRRYQDTVFGVALGRLGHPHDAEDIAQSVLVEGWERLADLRNPERLGPWLRSIAVRHSCSRASRAAASIDGSRVRLGRVQWMIRTRRRPLGWESQRQGRKQTWNGWRRAGVYWPPLPGSARRSARR